MDPEKSNSYPDIGDYGMIGDTRTAALVSRDGSIDWCCFPDFDSPAVFCKLLDAGRGGFFSIGPVSGQRVGRAYLGDTNVLVNTYRTGAGRFRVLDFMPAGESAGWSEESPAGSMRRICRLVEGEDGESEFEARINPSFGFAGEPPPRVEVLPGSIAFTGRNEGIVLTSPMAMKRENECWAGRMPVYGRRRIWFTLEYRSAGEALSMQGGQAFDPEAALRRTLGYWKDWIAGCTYVGPYRSQVLRSALTLKMLTYGPTGAMVAAPTTSLPESLGGGRNWDYRFCWLRDSALILNVLHAIGYGRDAVRFFDWLKRIGIDHRNPLAPFYTVRGADAPGETRLPHLEGYRGIGPVRMGNAARDQLQLDTYGELVDAVHMCYTTMDPPHPRLGREVVSLADRAAAHWREPDHGIWEFPVGPRHFLHSKLSCWMALDRAIRLADLGVIDSIAPGWKREREAVRDLILRQGFDSRLGALTQSIGSGELDAAVLAMPLVGFLPAKDVRVRSTVVRMQEELMRNGYLLRYTGTDGIPSTEGAFLLVNFWLVSVLCLQGDWESAGRHFERLLGSCNDLGLLAEEVDPRDGSLLGNFPQGISHLGLIRAALHLRDRPGSRRHGGAEQHPGGFRPFRKP